MTKFIFALMIACLPGVAAGDVLFVAGAWQTVVGKDSLTGKESVFARNVNKEKNDFFLMMACRNGGPWPYFFRKGGNFAKDSVGTGVYDMLTRFDEGPFLGNEAWRYSENHETTGLYFLPSETDPDEIEPSPTYDTFLQDILSGSKLAVAIAFEPGADRTVMEFDLTGARAAADTICSVGR